MDFSEPFRSLLASKSSHTLVDIIDLVDAESPRLEEDSLVFSGHTEVIETPVSTILKCLKQGGEDKENPISPLVLD